MMISNFGTPRKSQKGKKGKLNDSSQLNSSDLSSNNALGEANKIIEEQYKLFLFSMTEVYKFEKDPNISNKKFEILKKISSSSAENKKGIDLNQQHLKEFEAEIIAFMVISSYEETHQLFMEFYGIFDEDQNFKIEKDESDAILNFMALESQMGKNKTEYLMESLIEQKNTNTTSLTLKILQQKQQNQLSQDLKDEFFKIFANKNSKNINSQSLDLKKYYGVLFSFFFQFTRKRIQNRKEDWDRIRGIDNIKGLKTEITGMMTLSYALKNITGLDYFNENHRNSKQVSYRNIEAVLLAYRNANKEVEYDQIQKVLADVEKFMKVDPQTKIEFKKIKLSKLIDYASMRIAFHRCCSNLANHPSSKKFDFTEEIILWNSCSYQHKLRKEKLEKSLQQYIQANSYQDNIALDIQFVLNEYFKKKWPIFGKKSVERIIRQLVSKEVKSSEIHKYLYDEIHYEAQYKIKFYIMKIFSGFGQVISDQNQKDFLSCRGSIKWNDDQNSPQQFTTFQNATIKLSKFQKEAKNFQKNDQDSEIDLSREVINSKRKLPERQTTQHDNSNIYAERKPINSVINSKNKSNGDILNACFMMEGFLEKVQYMNKDKLEKFKKQNILSGQDILKDLDNEGNIGSSNLLEQKQSIEIKDNPQQYRGSTISVNGQVPQSQKNSIFQNQSQTGTYLKHQGSLSYQHNQRFSEKIPFHIFDLKRLQPDDYQDDILDITEASAYEQENKQELMNNSVIELMMKNNQRYQRRTEYQSHYPEAYDDKVLEDYDDINRGSMAQKKGQCSRFGLEKSQNLQNEQLQPKINKDVFNEVRRQQAMERLSRYKMMQEQAQEDEENLKKEMKNKQAQNPRTCANCSIF